jgi:hypothetical protein
MQGFFGGRRRQQSPRATLIVSLILAIVMSGLAFYTMSKARQSLERQHLLDARGVQTQGVITGKYTQGTTYLINYRFTLNRWTYQHVSPVTRNDYDSAMPGQAVTVVYLPDNPDVCRALQSIGEQRSESQLRSSYIILGAALLYPLLALVKIRSMQRRRAGF